MKSSFCVLLLTVIFFIMTGCATTTDGKQGVYAGMTKSELIGQLGQPLGITRNGETEYFSYKDPKKPALIKLVRGTVVTIISPSSDSFVKTKPLSSETSSYY